MNGVMLPPINEAIERRIRDGLSVVLAVPTGYTITAKLRAAGVHPSWPILPRETTL